MKHASYNSRGNMVVSTGFKKFDAATDCISTGNVFSSTQKSFFIRPFCETRCNGYDFKEGDLMKSDLKYFRHIADNIERIIYDPLRTESVILYEFFVKDDVIGHVLTTADYHLITYTYYLYPRCNASKRMDAIQEIIKYITCDGTTDIPEDVLAELRQKVFSGEDRYASIVYRDDFEYILRHHERDGKMHGTVPKKDFCITIYDRANSATRLLDTVMVTNDITRVPKTLAQCYCTNPFVKIEDVENKAILVDSDGKEIKVVADLNHSNLSSAIAEVNRIGLALTRCTTPQMTANYLFFSAPPKDHYRIGELQI